MSRSPYHGRPRKLTSVFDGRAGLNLIWPLNKNTGECAPYPQQAAFLSAPHKTCALLGGVGSGKTTTGAIGTCDNSLYNRDSLSLVVARDYDMLRNVQWKAIMETFKWWEQVNGVPIIRHASEFALRMKLINGTSIIFKTSKDIERVQGLQAQTIWGDEFPIWDDQFNAWKELYYRLRSTTERQRLKIFWTASPKGQFGIAALLQDQASIEYANRIHVSPHATLQETIDKGTCRVEMSTLDNTAQDPAYAKGLEGILSPEEWAQDIEGKIVLLRGAVFGGVFNLLKNVRTYMFSADHSFRLLVDHGANFPYASLVANDVDDDGEPRDTIIDEFVKNDIGGVHEIIWWAQERMRYWGINRLYGAYPDPSPQYRQANLAIQTAFNCSLFAYDDNAHRSVAWGAGLVKARLLDMRGKRHFFVARHLVMQPQNKASSGRGSIRGFMGQEWAERKSTKNHHEELFDAWKDQPGTHAMDATRYYISHEYRWMNPDGTLGQKGGIIVYK